jgi:LacI family transcriptional regulator
VTVRKRPTSADVAALAKVSRTTVSFVLNGRLDAKIRPETAARVLAAAEELGYHPHAGARQLAGGISRTLGLVLRQSPAQVAGDAMLAEIIRGVSRAARAADHRIIVEALEPGEGSYADLVRSSRTDGLIIDGPRIDDPELAFLVADGFPIVIQGTIPGLSAPSVDVDNYDGARKAVAHLIGLGHRSIACITNAPLAYTASAERLAGYRAALEAADLPYDSDLIGEGAFDAPSGNQAMQAVLGRCQPTAVFAASDVVALGAIAALRAAGISVPDQVSVVGFDDIPVAAFIDPPLTTVRLPAHELGLAAGRALLDRIAGRPVEPRTLLPTELVIRASSVAPPAG